MVSCVEVILVCYYAKGGSRLREHFNYAADETRENYLSCPIPRQFQFEGSGVNLSQKTMKRIGNLIEHFSVEGSWILDLCAGSGEMLSVCLFPNC